MPPIRMFKYLLLKSIFDLSDVDVVERSKYDISFKFFFGMAPEDDVINPKFIDEISQISSSRRSLIRFTHSEELIKSKSVTIKSTEHKGQEAFKNNDELKEKAKSRYRIEAKL